MAATVGVLVWKNNKGAEGSTASGGQVSTSSKAVQQLCQPTDYKETCVNALSGPAGNTSDPKQLIQLAFNVTVKHLGEDPRIQDALENCRELLEFSINDLQKSFHAFGSLDVTRLNDYVTDLKTWLSGAITYQQTCLDGFENTTGDTGEQMKKYLKLSGELTSNGLAIITELSKALSSYNVHSPTGSRKLLSDEISGGFPTWLSAGRRGLLQASLAAVKPNVVVAQDGSGKYKTINEALKDIPLKGNNSTFVIYVKAGVYKENVNITKSMDNLYLIGDGPTKTTITGSRSYVGGYNTYKTATFCKSSLLCLLSCTSIQRSKSIIRW
ncbi:hypothetical protein RHGRI_003226 [Rhododendron griersonianum]|uniref:Pectinesterase n=1 Tax=Rhododendron griersonianum TaxID=479676 RepID=A0AAV6L648_9ERIC|nr:hypothetical protein RHGRI_003226 [Rhododendron griersonianum]